MSSFGAFLAFLDATVVNVAFPNIRDAFPRSTISDLSWVLNAYNIAFASFLIVFGRFADLLGRKRLFSAGTLVFTLASLWCAVAGSLDMLVVARVVQALGAAMLVPASLALVVEAFPGARRSHAVGLWGASAAVAAGLGPPIGGALVEWGSWRWAFLVNLPFGAIALYLNRKGLVESRAPGRRRLPDLLGALLLAAALSALTLGIVQGNDWGWTSARILGSFVAAALLSAGFLVSSRRHPQPLLDPALVRIRPFAVGNALTVLAGMGFFAYLLTNILWLQYVWRWSVLESGLALVPGAVVAAVVAGTLGELADKHGYRRVILPGALVWCGAYLWYAFAIGPEPAFWSEWLPGQVLSGIGVGATLPVLGSAALGAVPGGRFATASAVNSSARQLGGVLGIAILVVIIGTPTPQNVVDVLPHGWIFCAVCFALIAVGVVVLGEASPAEQVEEPEAAVVAPYLPPQRSAESGDDDLGEGPEEGQEVGPESYIDRLPAGVRAHLEEVGVPVGVPAGGWLFRAGDQADAMYVITSGRLEVVVGTEERVRELGPGAIVGELGLLADERRSASVRARRDATMLRVTREAFATAMAADPAAPMAVARALAEQLRTPPTRRHPRSQEPSVVAVVSLDGAPVLAVADALSRRLAESLRVHLADAHTLDPGHLAAAERDHDRVILTASQDDGAGAWRQAIRQADRVVLVAMSREAPPEQWAGPEDVDLVLVGPAPAQEALDAWTQLVRPDKITMLAENDLAGGLQPLADRIGGRALGVVLAGGGAPAMSTVGVLLELEEAGLRIDRLAGCSQGAISAGLYATGMTAAEAWDMLYAEFVRRNPLGDYTVPSHALWKGERMNSALRRRFGEARIETSPRHVRLVSTDLYARKPYVHRSGVLWEAVSASARLPVLFPPMSVDGRVLVDGSVLDNLPTWLLTDRPEGPVIVVNLSLAGGDGPRQPRSDGTVRRPALAEVLLRTMTIGNPARNAEDGVYMVKPRSMGVGVLEFHQLDRMVESGRQAARRLLEETGGRFEIATASGIRSVSPEIQGDATPVS